jgi:hypothetical protein
MEARNRSSMRLFRNKPMIVHVKPSCPDYGTIVRGDGHGNYRGSREWVLRVLESSTTIMNQHKFQHELGSAKVLRNWRLCGAPEWICKKIGYNRDPSPPPVHINDDRLSKTPHTSSNACSCWCDPYPKRDGSYTSLGYSKAWKFYSAAVTKSFRQQGPLWILYSFRP